MIRFMNECFFVILIAYPILLLDNLYLHVVHLMPTLLLGVTVVSTLVVLTAVNLILALWGYTEEEKEAPDRSEKEVLSSDKPISYRPGLV
ncbi:hypothetical protein F5146DRAFT_1073584 [Armillaria mellea]|nr:hypothetical protein F5146DRAFT_1073584 [Armillaria mellea]